MTLVQKEVTGVYMWTPEEVNDMQGPCDAGFHVPLKSEWEGVINAGISLGAWTATGNNEVLQNFTTYLKIPALGYVQGWSGTRDSEGILARYWACDSTISNQQVNGYYISASYYYSSSPTGRLRVGAGAECNLCPIRAFKDTSVTPTSSWTKLYGTSIENGGIFWNSTDGLISISSNGTTWITIQDKNLGATTVWSYGDSFTDAKCGNYYQRGNNYGFKYSGGWTTGTTLVDASTYGPGNYYSSSTFIKVTSDPYNWDTSKNQNLRGGVTQGSGTVTVDTEIKAVYLWTPEAVSDMQGPCESGYHVPLKSEWEGVVNAGVSLGAWTTSSGKTNFCTYMKIPLAGMRGTSSSTSSQGSQGIYWACDFEGAPFAYNLYIMSDGRVYVDSSAEIVGGSIRPFKDTPVTPDSSWTTIYQGTGTAGIYYKSDLGLISISSNGTTRYTISDKNLGATTVYTYGNTLSEANCGKYYQRGNNCGFAWTGSVTTSSTKVDASTYGPGNYYESSTFITGSSAPYNWDSSNNDNLRGGVTQGSGTVFVEHKVRPAYKPRTFTITRTEKSDMSSGWTYSDDAAGLTAGDGAFDDFFGYSAVRLDSTGKETAEVKSKGGVLDITQLGTLTSGDNVMIKFPRRGIKMTKSGSTVTLSITDEPNKEGYQYYAFTKGTDAKDYLYLGAYKMSSGYKSLSGKSVLTSQSRATVRSGIKSAYDSSAGTNRYSQITIYPRWYINCLYMMKYGNPYAQSIVGQGYTNASSATSTGNTNSQTSATYGTTSAAVQVKLFGLEDRWGNVYEWLDGCYFNSSTQLTVDKTNSVFQDSNYSTNLGTASGGYMTTIGGDNDTMFTNKSPSAGSGTTYYTDNSGSTASRVLRAGGVYLDTTSAGPFCIWYSSASDGSGYHGSRLMYL